MVIAATAGPSLLRSNGCSSRSRATKSNQISVIGNQQRNDQAGIDHDAHPRVPQSSTCIAELAGNLLDRMRLLTGQIDQRSKRNSPKW